MLTSKEIAHLAVKALDDKLATHGKTLADEVDKVLSQAGEQPLRREGYRSGGWTLLDFGCVVVHIFSEEMRSFYSLDRLWSDAEKIDYKDFL